MYIRKTYRLGTYREVVEYHNGRYGAPGQKRQQKKKLTTEQRRKQNARQKMINCRRKLRANFSPGDYYLTLTYRKEDRPEGMEAAKEDLRKFLRKLRKKYRDAGAAMKWIANIEVGTRGAWHVHLVMNRVPGLDTAAASAWKYGRIQQQLLYEDGAFDRLAAYITKSPDTEERLAESHYSSSRNLPIPEPEVKIFRHHKTWKSIKVPRGWILEQSSVMEGINPVTGYPYRSYTLRRLE